MVQTKGLHHLHKRKRSNQLKKATKAQKIMDRIIYIVGIIGPLFLLPQVLKIWIYKDASGVSAISFAALGLVSALWIPYGIMHKEKPIIINYILFTLFNFAICLGAIIW
jgi:uncharacterized protein with PQ loop repeat